MSHSYAERDDVTELAAITPHMVETAIHRGLIHWAEDGDIVITPKIRQQMSNCILAKLVFERPLVEPTDTLAVREGEGVKFEEPISGHRVATVLENDTNIIEVLDCKDGTYDLVIHTYDEERGLWADMTAYNVKPKVFALLGSVASVSGRHSQSEDAQAAEGVACQSDGIHAGTPSPSSQSETALALTSDQSPVQKEGMVEKLVHLLQAENRDRFLPTHTRITCHEAAQALADLLTALTETKKERDRAQIERRKYAEIATKRRLRAEALQTENEALKAQVANVTKAIEQGETPESRAGCGMVRYDEHMAALTTMEKHLSEETARSATLTKRIEEYERALVETDIKLVGHAQRILTQYLIGLPHGLTGDAALSDLIALFDGPEQRRIQALTRALLNTKGESE